LETDSHTSINPVSVHTDIFKIWALNNDDDDDDDDDMMWWW
jgi:hypothetical protein